MGSHKLVVTAKPFKMDFYSNGVLVVSANQRGLLTFEQYRQKKERVEGDQVSSYPELSYPRWFAPIGSPITVVIIKIKRLIKNSIDRKMINQLLDR